MVFVKRSQRIIVPAIQGTIHYLERPKRWALITRCYKYRGQEYRQQTKTNELGQFLFPAVTHRSLRPFLARNEVKHFQLVCTLTDNLFQRWLIDYRNQDGVTLETLNIFPEQAASSFSLTDCDYWRIFTKQATLVSTAINTIAPVTNTVTPVTEVPLDEIQSQDSSANTSHQLISTT